MYYIQQYGKKYLTLNKLPTLGSVQNLGAVTYHRARMYNINDFLSKSKSDWAHATSTSTTAAAVTHFQHPLSKSSVSFLYCIMNPNRRADASRAGPADSKFDSAAESSALVVNKNIADTGSDLLRRAFGPSFNERQGATQTDEVQPRASEPPHEFEPLNKAAAIITQDGQPHVFQPADEDTVQPSEVVDRQQPAVPEPGNDNMQPKSTGEENEQAQTSNTNEQGDTLMADEFASEPTLGVGEIPPKYTSRESRIKLLRSSLKKSTPTREELRMDLLHYFSTSFISGEITGTFQE